MEIGGSILVLVLEIRLTFGFNFVVGFGRTCCLLGGVAGGVLD